MASQSMTYRWYLRSCAFLLVAVSGSWALAAPSDKPRAPKSDPKSTVSAPLQGLRAIDTCTGDPKFIERLGMSKRALVDTTRSQPVGMSVVDVDLQGRLGRRTQHESWSSAGYLGRVQRDSAGNVYTYPAPAVSLSFNPVEKANIIYRVDSISGEMTPFVELPKAAAATERNPYGVLALALDCEQQALYAASVYGSTSSVEHGVIVRIDLKTKAVKVVKQGFDALALTVVRTPQGKRLFVGSARDNAVVSYGLDERGELVGEERVEIRLDTFDTAQDKKPRVLRASNLGELYVRAIPFDYTLTARTVTPTAELRFRLSPEGFQLVEQKVRSPEPASQMQTPR